MLRSSSDFLIGKVASENSSTHTLLLRAIWTITRFIFSFPRIDGRQARRSNKSFYLEQLWWVHGDEQISFDHLCVWRISHHQFFRLSDPIEVYIVESAYPSSRMTIYYWIVDFFLFYKLTSTSHVHSCIHMPINMHARIDTKVCDRYCYSGVAFSAAKGMDIDWCKACDKGLIAPDCVIYLDMPVEEAAQVSQIRQY